MADATTVTAIISGTTALIAASSALGGVLISTRTDAAKERRRLDHDLKVKDADRAHAEASSRRTFEIENLQEAYDGLFRLLQNCAERHRRFLQKGRDDGLPSQPAPEDRQEDLIVTSRAIKSIRLILDDKVRGLAIQAHEAHTELSDPTDQSAEEKADLAFHLSDAIDSANKAMVAVADRLRVVVAGSSQRAAGR
jgi:hypothetical protein